MQLEAQDKLSKASEYYDYVLKEDQTNIVLPFFNMPKQ